MTTHNSATVRVPRRRGAVGGVLLTLLGAWGAVIPFVGPTFNFAFSPDHSWTWTQARGWLEVLPGAAAGVAGLILLLTTNRVIALAAAWLAAAGGAWFVLGPQLTDVLRVGTLGTPTASGARMRALESISYFSGLGAAILLVAAMVLGRLSLRSVGDLRAADQRAADERAAQRREADLRTAEQPVVVPSSPATRTRRPVTAASTARHQAGNSAQRRASTADWRRDFEQRRSALLALHPDEDREDADRQLVSTIAWQPPRS